MMIRLAFLIGPPRLTGKSDPVTEDVGKSVKLVCPADGDSPLMFEWFKVRVHLLSLGTNTSGSDYRVYTCGFLGQEDRAG